MQYESGDVYRDYPVKAGTSLLVGIALVPLDLTGCTASMVVDTLGTFAMAVQPAFFGPYAQSGLALNVAPATTSGWAPGLYGYRITVTFPNGDAFPMGHGKVQVS